MVSSLWDVRLMLAEARSDLRIQDFMHPLPHFE